MELYNTFQCLKFHKGNMWVTNMFGYIEVTCLLIDTLHTQTAVW